MLNETIETKEEIKEEEKEVKNEEIKEEEFLSCRISEPKKRNVGKGYWVYKVSYETNMKSFTKKKSEVFHRYSNFEWLSNSLFLECDGSILPPLPGKNLWGNLEKVVGVDTTGLISYRQRALTKFLVRVCDHPRLSKIKMVRDFFESTEQEFAKIKNKKMKARRGGSLGFYLFGKSKTKDDPFIVHVRKGVERLEHAMKLLKVKLENMMLMRRELSKVFMDYGIAFSNLGRLEKSFSNGSLSDVLISVSDITSDISKNTSVQAEKESIQVIETILYYQGMCESIKASADNLGYIRVEVEETKLITKNLRGPYERSKSSDGYAKKLEPEFKKQEKISMEKTEEFNKSLQYFKEDIKRFGEERTIDFKYMLAAFVKLQMDYATASEEKWYSLLPSIRLVSQELNK